MTKPTPRRLRAARCREPEPADLERLQEMADDLALDPDSPRFEDDAKRKIDRLVVRLLGTGAPAVDTLEAAGRFGRSAALAWLEAQDLDIRIASTWTLLDLAREIGVLAPTIKPGKSIVDHPELAALAPSRLGWIVRDAHRYARPQRVTSGALASTALRQGAGPGCYSVEDAREYLRLR